MAKRSNERKPKRAQKKRGAKKALAKKAPAKKGKRPRGSSKKSKVRTTNHPLRMSNQHVDFLTYKSAQVQKFYGEILELTTERSDVDGLSYLVVRTSGTSSLGFMPPHPDMRGEQPAPREPTLYFMVEDVGRAYEYLLSKGVAFVKPPELMPWGHRVLTTTDPEGRTVMLAGKVKAED